MKEIELYIESYLGIGGKDLSPVADLFRQVNLKKGEYLLKIGQYTTELCFVKEGLLRQFAYNESGSKEITQWIATQDSFTTDLSSFVFRTPSRWNIQALTNCQLYTISKEKYDSISEIVPNWAELDRLFMAKCFTTLENRIFKQLSMSAEEKYQDLLTQNPELFREVPLQYLASMLGMTPETLSRVRRRIIS